METIVPAFPTDRKGWRRGPRNPRRNALASGQAVSLDDFLVQRDAETRAVFHLQITVLE